MAIMRKFSWASNIVVFCTVTFPLLKSRYKRIQSINSEYI